MRSLVLIASIVVCHASAARADDTNDPRVLMRQAAAEQAETTPPASGPGKEASAGTRSRSEGQEAHVERTFGAAAAEAHRAAATAARAAAAGGGPAALLPTNSSTARAASGRNGAAEATQRSATSVAREHGVSTGHPGAPQTRGRP